MRDRLHLNWTREAKGWSFIGLTIGGCGQFLLIANILAYEFGLGIAIHRPILALTMAISYGGIIIGVIGQASLIADQAPRVTHLIFGAIFAAAGAGIGTLIREIMHLVLQPPIFVIYSLAMVVSISVAFFLLAIAQLRRQEDRDLLAKGLLVAIVPLGSITLSLMDSRVVLFVGSLGLFGVVLLYLAFLLRIELTAKRRLDTISPDQLS